MSSPDLFTKTVARTDRLWLVRPGAIAGIMHGPLPNKSNSRQLVHFGGQARLIKSKEARAYEDQFEEAVWRSTKYLEQIDPTREIKFKAMVYQESMRRDLDAELLPDLLQKFEVIKNDRAMWEKHYRRGLDPLNPRVEFLACIWTAEMKAVPFWDERELRG